jgi:hypothetical protein
MGSALRVLPWRLFLFLTRVLGSTIMVSLVLVTMSRYFVLGRWRGKV